MAITQDTLGPGEPIKFAADNDAITGVVIPSAINWVGVTTAGHALILHNTAGKIIFHFIAQAANDPVFILLPEGLIWDGIIAETLASGTLYVYRK